MSQPSQTMYCIVNRFICLFRGFNQPALAAGHEQHPKDTLEGSKYRYLHVKHDVGRSMKAGIGLAYVLY
jgi:hypothetical protein